ncbi:hypothetical protein Holit_02164 [Hollandina sp. SP2]
MDKYLGSETGPRPRDLKLQLYPDQEPESLINKPFGCCYKVYHNRIGERHCLSSLTGRRRGKPMGLPKCKSRKSPDYRYPDGNMSQKALKGGQEDWHDSQMRGGEVEEQTNNGLLPCVRRTSGPEASSVKLPGRLVLRMWLQPTTKGVQGRGAGLIFLCLWWNSPWTAGAREAGTSVTLLTSRRIGSR